MRPRVALSLLLVCCAAQVASAIEPDLPDVHEVEAQPDRYLNRPLSLVGRFASAGAGRVHLVGSKMEFVLGPEARVHSNPRHVELSGKLSRAGGKLRFTVDRLNKTRPESEVFAERRERIGKVNFPAMYALADWARRRAEWYQDSQLADLSKAAWLQAFHGEEEDLARRGQADALLALAQRGAENDVAPNDLERMRFRALLLKRASVPADDSDARLKLADEVQSLLGAQPADPVELPAELSDERLLAEYSKADAPRRQAWNRDFYADLVERALKAKSTTAESDLPALVEIAEERTPERGELIHELKRLELERRAKTADRLSRGEILSLRTAFQDLQLPERGDEVVRRWLAGRRSRLDRLDVEDRIALARDYLNLVADRAAAEELFRESLAIAPSPDAERGLSELGFVNLGGQWRRPAELREREPPAALEPGAAEQAVLATLGPPDSVSKTGGAGWIVEQWRYSGPPALWIYLRRSTATGQARVARVVAP